MYVININTFNYSVLFELSWIRVISKHHVVHEYETYVTGGRNVFICMKMTEFLSDYDKTSALNYWHKSTNCHAL